MAPAFDLRPMSRDELDLLVEWAAGEGWNPGVHDADVFWATGPEGFVAAEIDGQLVGGGSIVSYGASYGFMGLFIVRPDLRGDGLGRELWHARKRLLLERLDAGAAIEMDGVFEMQPFYAKGGFVFQHSDRRFEGVAVEAEPTLEVVDLSAIPFADVDEYDRRHFPAARSEFLRRWIDQRGGHAVGAHDDGRCRGFAVSRPCRSGHKIGPLFADDAAIAEALFVELSSRLAGETVYLDAPEVNAAALELAARHHLTEVFGCARMTLGPAPTLPWAEIFGVTTFELG